MYIMKTKHQFKIATFIVITASAPIAFSQTPGISGAAAERNAIVEVGSLTSVIGDSVTFSILTKALKAAGLDATLGTKGEFTIFAPTDEAFGKLPPGVLGKLILPENKEKLRSLLLYHVLAGRVLASSLKDGSIKTMNGEKVKIAVNGGKVDVDGSKVFTSDVIATNGVMHSIGGVIVPETLKEFIAKLAQQ